MQDPRALANPKNLASYRAWNQDGVRRSGFSAITTGVMAFAPMLTGALLLFKPARQDPHTWLVVVGTAFALYLAIMLGLTLFAVLRFNAWKRAHPWEPPPRRVWK